MKRLGMILFAAVFFAGMTQMALAVGEHGGKEHGGSAKKEHGGKEHGGAAKKEHGGKEHGGSPKGSPMHEHGGKEHGGAAVKAPSNSDIRNAMKSHVMEKSKATGTFDVMDPETGQVRNLKLQRVHQRVGKTGDYYYSCADFKDVNSGEMLDLDLDVADNGGKLSVADVRIHKTNGNARYTYDENDNRIPLKKPGSPKGSPRRGY